MPRKSPGKEVSQAADGFELLARSASDWMKETVRISEELGDDTPLLTLGDRIELLRGEALSPGWYPDTEAGL